MKTIIIGKKSAHARYPFWRSLLLTLCVDVIPILLLLAVLAGGMSCVAAKLSEPRSVDIVHPDKKHS